MSSASDSCASAPWPSFPAASKRDRASLQSCTSAAIDDADRCGRHKSRHIYHVDAVHTHVCIPCTMYIGTHMTSHPAAVACIASAHTAPSLRAHVPRWIKCTCVHSPDASQCDTHCPLGCFPPVALRKGGRRWRCGLLLSWTGLTRHHCLQLLPQSMRKHFTA